MAAIYMWVQRVVQLFTTTLYPIDQQDGIQLSIDVGNSSMSPLPQDDIDISGNVQSVVLNTILISYGPDQDELNVSANINSVTVNTIYISYGPYQDELDVSATTLDVILDIRKVVIDTPDEKLQLNCNIVTSGSTMTPV